jgi:putative ABC transport system ATP-binding protein
LDDQNCVAVYKLLEEQAVEEGSALVIVTHDNRLKSEVNHQIILQ